MRESPALRDPAFHSFKSGKSGPEIERTIMRLPACRNFVPSSGLYLQRIGHPGRNLNPRNEHLPACRDFGTMMSFLEQVEIVQQVGRTAASCVPFHPHVHLASDPLPLLTGVKCQPAGLEDSSRGVTISTKFLSAAFFPKESSSLTSKTCRRESDRSFRSIREVDHLQNTRKLT